MIDRQAFADRAVASLEDDELRTVVAREIVACAAERVDADPVAARPLLESVVGTLVETEPFRRVFHAAAAETNRAFFEHDRENVLFDLGDAAEIVEFGLRSVNPELADQLPQDLEPELVALRRRDFAGTRLRVADEIRVFGIVLPLAAWKPPVVVWHRLGPGGRADRTGRSAARPPSYDAAVSVPQHAGPAVGVR